MAQREGLLKSNNYHPRNAARGGCPMRTITSPPPKMGQTIGVHGRERAKGENHPLGNLKLEGHRNV